MKAYTYIIDSFDASNDYVIRYYYDGDQPYGSICIIKENNEQENEVYNATQFTMHMEHTIPKNTLTNGKQYTVTIATVDAQGNKVSEDSDKQLFYCYTQPTFEFTNIKKNQVIRNSSYKVVLKYEQKENELLQSYKIDLYDSNKNLLKTSSVKYDTSDLSFLITELEDNTEYYIAATGMTVHNMPLSIAYTLISAEYVRPAIYSVVSLENIYRDGCVKLQSNIRAIKCKTTNSPVFVDDEFINVINDKVYIDEDFSFNNNFYVNAIGKNLSYGLLMSMRGNDLTTNLYLRKGTFSENNNIEKSYVELIIPIGNMSYVCKSNYVDVYTEQDTLSISVIRRNGLYDVCCKKVVK